MVAAVVALAVGTAGAVTEHAAAAAPGEAPVARFDPDDPTFAATPWPSDRLDFGGSFPNPDASPFLDNYLAYADGAIDGFSRNGAVYFGLTAAIDAATLPSPVAAMNDPRAAAQLVDLTAGSLEYGRRFPLEFAQRVGGAHAYYPVTTLVMRPVDGFPLADAHTYSAFLTDDLRGATGRRLVEDRAFSRALSVDPTLAPLQTWLRGAAVSRGHVVVGTCFTTQDATGELRAIEAFLPELPTTDLYDVEPGVATAGYQQILARYRAPAFQTGTKPYFSSGGDFEFGHDGRPVVAGDEELRVRIVVPQGETPAGGWPVVLYGHGTGGDWSSCLDIANDVTRDGLAMVCIDQPLHGERGGGVDPTFVTFNILNPASARTNFRQGAVDTSWLARLITDGRFDLSADTTGLDTGVALNPDTLGLFGHSQGAVTGALTLAVAPLIDGGVLSGTTGLFGSAGLLQRQDPIDVGAFLARSSESPRANWTSSTP